MANNSTLDTLMLSAAQLAYDVSDTGVYTGSAPEGYVVEDTSLFPRERLFAHHLTIPTAVRKNL